jgi:hypothetical protein
MPLANIIYTILLTSCSLNERSKIDFNVALEKTDLAKRNEAVLLRLSSIYIWTA